MVPYFYIDHLSLGPLSIQIWGLFVALGIISGALVAIRRAKKFNIQPKIILDLVFWMTLGAFVSGRAVFVLANKGLDMPSLIERTGSGFSSLGAVVAGLVIFFFAFRKYHFRPSQMLCVLGPALLLAEGVGRIGCFLIHEHVGRASNFILAVNFDGVTRHDLGLYFSLSALLGFALLIGLEKIDKFPTGSVGWLSFVWYFIFRYFLEFLYENGGQFGVTKYFGLTVMQMISLIFFVVVIALSLLGNKKPYRHDTEY